MRKIKLFIAMSLDGYIATLDDSLDWLMKVDGKGDNGYGDFMRDIDTVIMGRTTYDWVMNEMNGDYPYKEQVGYVYTHQTRENTAYITYTDEPVQSLGRQLKASKGKDIWIVGGGQLICDFLEAGLVDEMTLTLTPVLLGEGIRLFPEGSYESEWRLTKTETFNQFVNVHYEKK
ncbi:dihydrofolate reductase family protein [Kurthia sp. Dielmo]|uniref:dihydrofolate reductase family protein n=1 Tax=Kurthia sp. Dielmo TaxID=1033738 RepID=UPI002104D771|nr:dihydrofolate reductase family protein [Kurthia sp. Dielmo]